MLIIDHGESHRFHFQLELNNMCEEVIKFWFEEIDQRQWWLKDDAFDQHIRLRFLDVHAKAVRCELFDWRGTAKGRLAEIIVLDQFSRNMFRGLPQAFAQDSMALILSQEAISLGIDNRLKAIERGFLYLPFMHSESLKIQEIAEAIYRLHGVQSSLDYAIKHKRIIEKFGRYPHRNETLGRTSTPEEIAFLEQPGSSF